MRLAPFFVLAYCIVGCSRAERTDKSAPSTAAPSRAASGEGALSAPPPTAPEANGGTSREVEPSPILASVASFRGDQLVACIDATFRGTLFDAIVSTVRDGGMSREDLLADDLHMYLERAHTILSDLLNAEHKGRADLLRPPGTPQDLTKSCDQQFASRVVSGRCSTKAHSTVPQLKAQKGLDASTTNSAVGTNVDVSMVVTYYRIGRDDGAMRKCLDAKSDWQE